MLFAVSVSWSIVRHCPSPSFQGANTLRGDNLLALLHALSAGPLVRERGRTVVSLPDQGSLRSASFASKVRFPPFVNHPRGPTCLLTNRNSPFYVARADVTIDKVERSSVSLSHFRPPSVSERETNHNKWLISR